MTVVNFERMEEPPVADDKRPVADTSAFVSPFHDPTQHLAERTAIRDEFLRVFFEGNDHHAFARLEHEDEHRVLYHPVDRPASRESIERHLTGNKCLERIPCSRTTPCNLFVGTWT